MYMIMYTEVLSKQHPGVSQEPSFRRSWRGIVPSRGQQGELRIPVAPRPTAEQIITLTDQACAELLDEEYAALAQHVLAKLGP